MPKKVNKSLKTSASSGSNFDISRIFLLTSTVIAIAISVGLALPTLFPPQTHNNAIASHLQDTSPVWKQDINQGLPTDYMGARQEPMRQDEDGIWRPAREVVIDDDGRPVWIGNGLRKKPEDIVED